MSEQDYLLVEVRVMVPLGPDSEDEWPEERCAEEYRRVVDHIASEYTISTQHDWRVITT